MRFLLILCATFLFNNKNWSTTLSKTQTEICNLPQLIKAEPELDSVPIQKQLLIAHFEDVAQRKPKYAQPAFQRYFNYFEKHYEVAKQIENLHGVPVCVQFALAVDESGCGRSPVAKKFNNHFGIKTRNGYIRYKSSNDGFWGLYRNVFSNSRFKHLLEIPKDDYKSWCMGLSYAGYSYIGPHKGERLIKIIESFELYKL